MGSAANMVWVLRNLAKHDVKLNVAWRTLLSSGLLAGNKNKYKEKCYAITEHIDIQACDYYKYCHRFTEKKFSTTNLNDTCLKLHTNKTQTILEMRGHSASVTKHRQIHTKIMEKQQHFLCQSGLCLRIVHYINQIWQTLSWQHLFGVKTTQWWYTSRQAD